MTVWRERRFRYLLNLIDHLPTNSFFVELVADDDELANSMQSSASGEKQSEQRISTWSPEKEILVGIFDRLGTVVSATIAAAGAKPPDIKPYPRPQTAFQRADSNSVQQKHESLVKRLLRK